MRAVITACLAAAMGLAGAGCDPDRQAAFDGTDDGGDGEGGSDDLDPAATCTVAADCVAVSASCCGCPDLALPVGDAETLAAACNDVMCPEPPPGACAAVEVRCEASTCVLGCPATVCDLTCDAGFAVDPTTGCQTCACAAAQALQCQSDDDCAAVPADCCGCAAGGADTAVPAADAASWLDALGCDGTEACPGLDVCDAGQVPRCLAGTCQLAPPGPLDGPPACGALDAVCPTGTVCVIGDDLDGNGLGDCLPAP